MYRSPALSTESCVTSYASLPDINVVWTPEGVTFTMRLLVLSAMKTLPDPSTATAVVLPNPCAGTVVCNSAKLTDCACNASGAVRVAIDRAAQKRLFFAFRDLSKLLQGDPAAIDLLLSLRWFFIFLFS